MLDLSPEKARIFRITHIENIAWIIRNGLHCQNSPVQDPDFRIIGLPDIIAKRASRVVPIAPGGTLNDYIPFYFTPFSPMLYNIKTGYNVRSVPMEDIVILVGNPPALRSRGSTWVFTDRHALMLYANYYSELSDLSVLDWESLQARDFRRVPDNPEKMDRYQAEALIHRYLPITSLSGLVCHGRSQEEKLKLILESGGAQLPVVVKPGWYF